MNRFIEGRIADSITLALKEAAQEVLTTCNAHDDLKHEMERKVNAKLTGLTASVSFRAPIPYETQVCDVSYKLTSNRNGMIKGEVVIAHCQKRDIPTYGGPGYPGKNHGDLCVYPEYSRNFYKWNAPICRWEAILQRIDRGHPEALGWYEKLMHNPAFEPLWGSNTHGGDLHSGRDGKGQHEAWGTVPIRKPMGTFRKVSAEVMKSVYHFFLDIKSALGHFERIGRTFGYGEEEGKIGNAHNSGSEKEAKTTRSIDTTTYTLDAQKFSIHSNKQYSGHRKDYVGYEKARKDSTYFVNLSDNYTKIKVVIKKKY